MTTAAALAALVSGCGPMDDGADVGEVSSPLIGGEATSDYDEVVFVYDSAGRGCSGVLVAADRVLTTANCAGSSLDLVSGNPCPRAGEPAPAGNFRVLFGDELTGSPDPSALFEVSAVTIAPLDICFNDLAVLTLSEPVDPSIAEPRRMRLDAPVTSDETFTAVGFGDTTQTPSGFVPKNLLEGNNVLCVGSECNEGDRAIFGTDAPGSGADGGGPAIDADGAIMGLISYGDSLGHQYSAYVHLYDFADWLADEVPGAPQPEPPPDPSTGPDDLPPPPTSEGGCQLGSAPSGDYGLWALALLALVAIRRRRTS